MLGIGEIQMMGVNVVGLGNAGKAESAPGLSVLLSRFLFLVCIKLCYVKRAEV
jgi:hypothetical protein